MITLRHKKTQIKLSSLYKIHLSSIFCEIETVVLGKRNIYSVQSLKFNTVLKKK